MTTDLQSWYEDADSLIQFIARSDEAGVDTPQLVAFLRVGVWSDNVPSHRIERVVEQERSRLADLATFDVSESTTAARYVDITDIDFLSGYEFETVLAESLSRIDGDAEVTRQSGDQGIDVIWYTDSETIAIQAKAYSKAHKVSNSAVQEANTGSEYYGTSHSVDRAAVVTTSTYTPSARELAEKTGVRLYGRSDVQHWLSESKLEAKTLGTLIE